MPNASPAERVARPRAPAVMTETGASTGDEALRLVMSRVAAEFDVHAHLPAVLHDQERWTAAQRAIERAVDQLGSEGALGDASEREAMIASALRESVGLGPLETLLADDRIHELVVNGPASVMADKGDGLEPTAARFSDSAMLTTIVRRLLAQGGKDLDASVPMHQVALPYGPHVTVLLPPLALRGPVLEIRRIRKGRTLDELVSRGVLSTDMRELLRKAVSRKRRVAVIGPSSSGVTTLLGALAQLSDERERLITIEAVADLALDRPGTVTLSAGSTPGRIRLAEAIHQAGLLRSDRLVIDDVADGTDLAAALAALATRHAGDLLGVHGGRDPDALEPLRLLLGLGATSAEAAETLIARAIDLVVEVDRLEEGNRVVAISEVVRGADGKPRTTRLFTYDGAFVSAGQAPQFLEA
jgi:pilus assembly protein CpaF